MGTKNLALPPYSSTYTDSGGSRGYAFQALATFTITGFRVPDDDHRGGAQYLQAVRFTRKPSHYSSHTPYTTLFYHSGSGTSFVPTSVRVRKGEWIGVLGSRAH